MNWHSGFERIPNDKYETPEHATEVLLPFIEHVSCAWECACGSGQMVRVLARGGRRVVASDIESGTDFLKQTALPVCDKPIQAIITNSPFGKTGTRFVEHALGLMKPVNGLVAMLFPADFDFYPIRAHLFDPHPAWGRKVAIKKRIRWINGTTGHPRLFHAWFLWNWRHAGEARCSYPKKEVAA